MNTHDAESDWTPTAVGHLRAWNWVVVNVNYAVQEGDCGTSHRAQTLEVNDAVFNKLTKVDGTKVADCGLVVIGNFQDFGAEVRKVNRAPVLTGLVAEQVRAVFEGHPAVTGLGQGAHHATVECTSLNLTLEQSSGLSLLVRRFELGTVEVGELGNLLGVEK